MEPHQPHLKRRHFLKSGLVLSAVGLLTPAAASRKTIPDEDFKIAVGPCLQTSFGNNISILWITTKNAASWVEYGLSADKLDQKAYGKSAYGLRPTGKINVIKLQNLQPGTRYYYRIVSKEIVDFQPYKLTYGKSINSEVHSFVNTDIAKEEIRFVMLNDIHDRPKSIPFLLDLDKEKKNDFIFFNGDIFDYQTNEQQIIHHMLQPCADAFAKETPFVYVRGNHETRGKYCREFPQYFENVGYDAFTLGPVRFVLLDTGEDKEDAHPVYAGIVDFDAYRLQQAEWFKQEMESKAFKKAKFRVILMHIPPCFGGNAPGEKHVNSVFNPLLNKAKVDIVLSGHTHRYIIRKPNEGENNYPIIVGGGPTEGRRTMTKVTADKNQLKVVMLNDKGEEAGSYILKK